MAFQEILASLLVDAGSVGLKQSEITHKMQRHADADALQETLTIWWNMGKVQRFSLPSNKKGGRPTRVWRATKALILGSDE